MSTLIEGVTFYWTAHLTAMCEKKDIFMYIYIFKWIPSPVSFCQSQVHSVTDSGPRVRGFLLC